MAPKKQHEGEGEGEGLKKFLNVVIKRKGCDAILSRKQKHVVFAKVLDALGGQSLQTKEGREVAALTASQVVDELTNGDPDQNSRRKALPSDGAGPLTAVETLHGSPLEAAQEAERTEAIERAIQKLPSREREVIRHYYHHHDIQATMVLLGVSRAEAYRQINRIIAHLADELRGHR